MSSSDNPADFVRQFLRRYVVLTEEQLVACSLWVLHTWAFEAALATPYMVVASPTKQAGKTRLLEVLERLVREPLRTESITEAALFRAIDQLRPTVLLDEVDAVFASSTERMEPLRAVLNAGNRAGSQVTRSVPPNWNIRQFSVFCPKALAGIDNGRWPDTLLDRSIVIRVRRKLETERVERFRFAAVEGEASIIRGQLDFWATQHLETLKESRPTEPEGLSDRAADAWEPLLAVADLLDGDWPVTARSAAVGLFHRQEELEDTLAVALLADIRDVFDATGDPKLKSVTLCAALCKLPDSGWSNFGARRGQKGLRPSDVAMLLRPFGITPHTVRLDKSDDRGSTAKGYARIDFEDAWTRYLTASRVVL